MARQIVVDIIGDSSKFEKSLDAASSKSKGFGSVITGMAMGGGMALFNAATNAASGAVDYLSGAMEKGSDRAESISKIGVIFGRSADDIVSWSKTSAKALGMSQNAALEAAGVYGNLFTAMKIAPAASADMSKGLIQLASDMASFNNANPEDVLEALRAGLTGETEPLKKFGINLNEATIKAKAMSMGLYNGKGNLDAAAKAQAVYALVLEQSTSAQGDFARTADGAANSGRIFQAKMDDLQATIGTKLQPVWIGLMGVANNFADMLPTIVTNLEPVVTAIGTTLAQAMEWVSINVIPKLSAAFQWFVDNVIPVIVEQFNFIATNVFPLVAQAIDWITTNVVPALGAAFKWFAENVLPVVRAAITWVIKNVLPALGAAINWISQNVIPPLSAAFKWFAEKIIPIAVKQIDFITKNVLPPLGKAFDFITNTALPAIGTAINTAIGIFNNITTTINTVKTNITTAFNNIVSFITGVPGRMSNALGSMFSPLWDGFKGAINKIIYGWNRLEFTLPAIDMGPLGKFGGFTIGTPNLPYLHAGGIVPGAPGSDQLAILQAGERVIPRNQVRSGATEVHIHIDQGAYIDGPSIDRLANIITKRMRYASGI